MDIREQDFHNYVNEQSQDFKIKAKEAIISKMQERGYEVTGKLRDSIRIEVEPRQSNTFHAITLYFLEKGKGLDSKKNIIARASVEQTIDWIKSKGLQYFEFIPGYANTIPSLDVAARRLAYVFLNNPATDRPAYKGPWLYKEYYGEWADHRQRIINQFFEKIPDTAFDTFMQAYSQAKGAGKGIKIK